MSYFNKHDIHTSLIKHCIRIVIRIVINDIADSDDWKMEMTILIAISCHLSCQYLFILFIYLALPTRAGSPQQHMPITVGPFT
jgi:hypothetical protein